MCEKSEKKQKIKFVFAVTFENAYKIETAVSYITNASQPFKPFDTYTLIKGNIHCPAKKKGCTH